MSGRAALLQKLKERQSAQVGVPPDQPLEQQPQVKPPGGRASLLRKIQESREKKVGLDPSVSNPEISHEVRVSASSSKDNNKCIQKITKEIETLEVAEEQEKDIQTYKGDAGKQVNLTSNYIRLNVEKDRGVFEYEVRFIPEVDSKNIRFKMVNQHMSEMGNIKMFDGGAVLYLPHLLTETSVQFQCSLPDGDDVTMEVKFKRKKRMGECLHLYNVLFKRIMKVLMYSQMGRNYFNHKDRHLIPQHRLEVYPGFAVTVDELEDGLLLCLDTQHRVLRSQNVYELMMELRNQPNFRESFTNAVIGSCVLTRYNNKTYIIDDINWECTASHKFQLADGSSISFIDYYKKNYNLTINDENQPMLINRKSIKNKDGTGKLDRMICLIPELSYLTGLTDAMRADFKIMKDVAVYTRVTPAQRVNALKKYLRNVAESEDAQNILSQWGLSLDSNTIKLQGRTLEPEMILFGENKEVRSRNGDWTRAVSDYKVTLPVDLMSWVVFHTARDKQFAGKFADTMTRMGSSMGCVINRPRLVTVKDDRNESYVQGINDNINDNVQCAVFICPTLRADRYSIIKKLCLTQYGVASQVILSRTLSNDQKSRAIIQKIALQINCKLGGTLWTLRFPFKNWMIIGIDVYHSPKGSKNDAICGVVCSMNENISRYFSMAVPQKGELGEFYRMVFSKALENYRRVNGAYPAKIVIFRDGVGDGQLDHCLRYEVAQFESTLQQFSLDIKICFVVVQKRISTRVFLNSQELTNPEPGTVLDHSVTRRYLKDFFLIPQNVRQGTVNPTHYIVLYDTCNLKPDHVQRLAFKLCHLYYNWSGTVRVPAPCQYAHKLAGLYGQHLNKAVCPELADKLYYL